MSLSQRIQAFASRHPLLGPLIWVSCSQYFVAQYIVALAWNTAYSIRNNTISDLGNTACATYDHRFVCSPLHLYMNLSFILLGLAMAIGALVIYGQSNKSVGTLTGLGGTILAGIGTILVGFSPENSISWLHILGASLPLVMGNIGVIVLGNSLAVAKPLRIYSFLTGFVTLAGLILFVSHIYLGIGDGGMERVAAYPQPIWLIVYGCYATMRGRSTLKLSSIMKP